MSTPEFPENPSRHSDLPDSGTAPDAAGVPASPSASTPAPHEGVAHTRTRATYIGWIIGILVTILLLIFILQNLNKQEIHFFNLTADVPVGISLLIAAIAGALITALLSGARIVQVNRALKKANR